MENFQEIPAITKAKALAWMLLQGADNPMEDIGQ